MILVSLYGKKGLIFRYRIDLLDQKINKRYDEKVEISIVSGGIYYVGYQY